MTEDTGLLSATRQWLSRRLSPGANTYVEGGGNDVTTFHDPHDRSRDRLGEYESIYERGGPVASLVDTRALMAFGTGAEFTSNEDEETVAVVDGEAMTVTEFLNDAFDNLDNLLVQIGKDAYIYGDALGEIVETRGGGFSHLELVNPKTMSPFYDDHGRIHRWEQRIKRADGRERTESFPESDIAHFKLHCLGRSPLGISLIEQNYDEIKRFARNQEAIENAMRLHGFPKYHVKAGREGGGKVPESKLRQVRRRFNNFNEKTNWVTGTDIAIDVVDTSTAEFEGLAEHDLMILAAGFGVPEEMAGLGRGSTEATAKVRLQSFERNARAEQRQLADQFIEQVARVVLARYSPFPPDVDLSLEFGDVVSDQTATAEWLAAFREYYTVDEVREKLGDTQAPEDADLGPPEGATPEPGAGDGQGPFSMDQTADESATPQGGVADGRRDEGNGDSAADPTGRRAADGEALQNGVPDEAVSISDPSEAPADAQIVTGPRGGTYWVPGGGETGDEGGEDGASGEDREAEYDGEGEPPEPLTAAVETGVFDNGEFTLESMDPVSGPEDLPENWRNETEIPIADAPEEYGYHAATATASVEDFKRLQERIVSEQYPELTPGDMDEWWAEAYPETTEGVEAVLRGEAEPDGGGIPLPYVEIGSNGNLRGTQEGRSRAIAAENAGVDRIPFRILFNDEREGHMAAPLAWGRAAPTVEDPTGGRHAAAIDEHDVVDGTEISSPFEIAPEGFYTEGERAFHEMYEKVLWPDDAVGRKLFGVLTSLPDNVRERIVEVIREGALFPEFEGLTPNQRDLLREFLLDKAAGAEGWTIRELADQLRQIDANLTEYEAERIARTESQSVVTNAREDWYSEDFPADEEPLFIWQGPQDHRTTDACEWLKEETNPWYGGTPHTLPELQDKVEEAQKKFFPNLDIRRWTPHPFCRHSVVRHYNQGAAAE